MTLVPHPLNFPSLVAAMLPGALCLWDRTASLIAEIALFAVSHRGTSAGAAIIWFKSDIPLKAEKSSLPPVPNDSSLWKREELAAYLNCALRTVDELTASGVLPVIKLTRRMVRYRPSEVMKVLEQFTVKERND